MSSIERRQRRHTLDDSDNWKSFIILVMSQVEVGKECCCKGYTSTGRVNCFGVKWLIAAEREKECGGVELMKNLREERYALWSVFIECHWVWLCVHYLTTTISSKVVDKSFICSWGVKSFYCSCSLIHSKQVQFHTDSSSAQLVIKSFFKSFLFYINSKIKAICVCFLRNSLWIIGDRRQVESFFFHSSN